MGTWTFAEFKRFLKFRNANDASVENVDGTNLYSTLVNQAYTALTTRKQIIQVRLNLRFPELEEISSASSTTDGYPYITIATGAVMVLDVFDATTEVTLSYIPMKKYLSYADRYDTDSEGPPTEWTRFGGYIYLHPTPDKAYSLRQSIRKKPILLSATTDTTVIGTEWDEPILEMAVYKLLNWQHEYVKSKFVKDEL